MTDSTRDDLTAGWIDADLHVLEHRSVIEKYLEPEYRHRVTIKCLLDEPVEHPTLLTHDYYVDGNPIPAWLPGYNRLERVTPGLRKFLTRFQPGSGWRPEQYLADLSVDGVGGGAVFPTLFLWVTWFPHLDVRFGAALARAYNDYIHDFCAAGARRLFPVAVVSLHDVQEAIAEVKRNAARGFIGVVVRPNPLNGRTLGSPDYFPFYETLQELELSLAIHEGTLAYNPVLGADRVTTQAGIHIIAHPFEQMAAMLSMYEAKVFARFPRMNTLFLEAGVGWVPWWIKRIDDERRQYRPGTMEGELMMDAFRRQCWVSAEADDVDLARIVDWLGHDRILMSSDYPHAEATFPETAKLFEAQPLSREALTAIGKRNPLRAYPRIAKLLG